MHKKQLLAVMAMLGFVFAVSLYAADANNVNGTVTIKGKVHVTKDKNGNVESVEIKASKTYHVTLDAKGQELGNTMKGKKVEATGVESTKNKEKWITVENYK